jgi:broad specificity phosphatase PhoE
MLRALPLIALLVLAASAGLGDEPGLTALKSGGHIAIVRHGETTPGTGDPLGFKLDDCATQRNLVDKGREESRRLGRLFRERGIAFERVLSSEWCRCIETAELIAAGRVEKLSALNNLFGRPQNRAEQVEALRKLIGGWKGGNLLLVTHGATMGAFVGINPQTAAGVILAPAPDTQEGFRVVGRISPEG